MRISGAPGEPPQIQAECLGLSDPGTALLLRVNRACLGPLRATQDQGGYRVATGAPTSSLPREQVLFPRQKAPGTDNPVFGNIGPC